MVGLLDESCEHVLDDNETTKIVQNYLNQEESCDEKSRLKTAAIASLQLFIRYNWLCSDCDHVLVDNELIYLLDDYFSDPVSLLAPNERHILGSCRFKHLSLLCFANYCLPLFDCQHIFDCFWALRILVVKQLIIHEPNSSIYDEICGIVEELKNHLHELDVDHRLIVNLNLCNVYLWYKQIQPAKERLELAIAECNLTIDLEGKLGKRTKYQEKSKPLLQLNITRKTSSDDTLVNTCQITCDDDKLPNNIALNDDTLLGQTEWDDKSLLEINLKPVEELLLSTIMTFMIASGSSEDTINLEQISSFLEYIIRVGRTWSVIYKCLFLRSLHEVGNMRKMERSIMQLEELINESKNVAKNSCHFRIKFFHSLVIDPVWLVEKTLADILYNTGCIKSSLEIYQRLQLWEPIVLCYCRLDRKDKAETLVRQQLESGETPYLLCLLGDVTEDTSHYKKALEISNNQSARAYKSLGDYYFKRKEYADCMDFFEKSLEINSMQHNCWARLAYAALVTEKFHVCVKAYRRALQFDDDNYEAWNNLSKAYIKLGDKKLAYKTLQEALKYNYDDWRIWENFLHVSLDVGELESVVNAWHRLIDIKGKHSDDEIVKMMVDAAILMDKESIENNEKPYFDRLLKKLLELLGRISSTSPVNGLFWLAYANLLASQGDKREDNLDKILNLYTKSYQCYSRCSNWQTDFKLTVETIQNCCDIADNFFELEKEFGLRMKSNLYSFERWLKSVIVIVNNNQYRWENDADILKTVTEAFNSLQKSHTELLSRKTLASEH